jgi:arginine/lysine/ornithine decarboxylase
VPVIAAGEVVTSGIVDYLACMRDSGAILKGATDPGFTIVKVMSSL